MRTTIDIQDAIFRRAKSIAAAKGLSLKAFINSAVIHEMERMEAPSEPNTTRVEFPIVPSNKPGKRKLTAEKIHDLLEEEDLDALS